MIPAVTITPEDRRRGWAELEITVSDGNGDFHLETVRVHAAEPSTLIRLAGLAPGAAITECLAKVLRCEKEFAARITGGSQLEIMMTLASLLHGDVEAVQITKEAVELVGEKSNG